MRRRRKEECRRNEVREGGRDGGCGGGRPSKVVVGWKGGIDLLDGEQVRGARRRSWKFG